MKRKSVVIDVPVSGSRYHNFALIIMIITVICFILQISIPGFTEWFYLTSTDAFVRPWMFLTAMFMHSPGGIWHIFFNMFGLLMFGPILEQRIGSNKFLFLYLVGGIF